MRSLFGLLLLAVLAFPAFAQDIVGFDRDDFGKIVLSANQSGGIELELSVGSYNNESIRNYSPNSVFAGMGRAVGRLDILTDNGVFPCTAFIVDEKHILTNYHCVPGIVENDKAGASRIDAVQFVAGYVQQGVEENTKAYVVSPTPVEANKALDYAVLEVIGNPSATYGTLSLSPQPPEDGDPYWVIGHPMGEAQRISREKCRANAPALSQNRLLHTCDTLPGNSGSPVIDASLQMVVGLHHAGSRRDSVNFAIPMGLILDQSSVLVAGLGRGPGAVTSDAAPDTVDICPALWDEARSTQDCFAYEAYATACDSHAFAPIAALFLSRRCAAPEEDTVVAAVAPSVGQKPKVESAAEPPMSDAQARLQADLAAVTKELNTLEGRMAEIDQRILKLRQEANVARIVGNTARVDANMAEIDTLTTRKKGWAIRLATLRLTRRHLSEQNRVFTPVPDGPPDWSNAPIEIAQQLEMQGNDFVYFFDVTFSPDGRQVAAVDDHGILRLWELVNEILLIESRVHSGKARAVAFSPDGRYIATGGEDRLVRLTDAIRGSRHRTLAGHDNVVSSVAFSPDGRIVASGSKDGTVRLWDAESGKSIRILQAHDRGVLDIVFSPDGTRVYSASADNTVIAWTVADGKVAQRFIGHEHWVLSLDISPDGNRLVTGSADTTMRLWDTGSGRQLRSFDHDGEWVSSVVFNPLGGYALSVAPDTPKRIWNLDTGDVARVLEEVPYESDILAFSPDARRIVSAGSSPELPILRLTQ